MPASKMNNAEPTLILSTFLFGGKFPLGMRNIITGIYFTLFFTYFEICWISVKKTKRVNALNNK